MNDFLLNQAISTLLFFLSPANRLPVRKWKRALLKIFRAIARAFPNDEDFQTQ